MAEASEYKVWQDADGKWCCASWEFQQTYSREDTVEQAIASHEAYRRQLAKFQADFDIHFNNECDPTTCQHCERKRNNDARKSRPDVTCDDTTC